MKCKHHKKYNTCYICKEIKNNKYINTYTLNKQIQKLTCKVNQIQLKTC